MKIVVQRVTHASCKVDNIITGSIKQGYVLLVGFTHSDTLDTAKYLAHKVAKLRVFEDEDGKLNTSIKEKQYAILSISQFTLYGDAKKGNRPSFTNAMRPEKAQELYTAFNNELREVHHIHTEEGVFGKHMNIELNNDGPVTILLEK